MIWNEMKYLFYFLVLIHLKIAFHLGYRISHRGAYPIQHLHDIIDIRAYVRNHQAKARVAKKKATSQKKRLLKVQEVLR